MGLDPAEPGLRLRRHSESEAQVGDGRPAAE